MKIENLLWASSAKRVHEVYYYVSGQSHLVHLFFGSHEDAMEWRASHPKIDSTYIRRTWGHDHLTALSMVEVEGPPPHVRGVFLGLDQKKAYL